MLVKLCCRSPSAHDGVRGPGKDESQHMDDGHLERLHHRPLGFVVVGSLGQSAPVRVVLPKRRDAEMTKRQ